MKNKNKVLQRAQMIWDDGHVRIVAGEIRRELMDDIKTIYVIDLNKESIAEILKYAHANECTLIPGLDIDEDGYYVEYKQVPFIVEQRVPDRRRQDIDKICAQNGMRYYDEFTFFLKNKGRCLDEWSVEEIPIGE